MDQALIEQVCRQPERLRQISWRAPVAAAEVQQGESFCYLLVADKRAFTDEMDALLVLLLRLQCVQQEWAPDELAEGDARITAFSNFLADELQAAPCSRISYANLARTVDFLPEVRAQIAGALPLETSKLTCIVSRWNEIEVFGESDGHYFVLNWYTLA